MPKKKSKPIAAQPLQASCGPRLKRRKPLLAIGIVLAAVAHALATWNYRCDQQGFYASIARRTSDFGQINPMGTLGSDLAFLSLHYIGILSWLILPVLLHFAVLFGTSRPKQVSWFKLFSTLLLFAAGCSLFTYAEPRFLPDAYEQFPEYYFSSDMGGVAGNYILTHAMGDLLGPVGTGLILTLITLWALSSVFIEPIRTILKLCQHIRFPLFPVISAPIPRSPNAASTAAPDLPPLMKAKRNWLKPFVGKPVVEATADDGKKDFYYDAENQPDASYLANIPQGKSSNRRSSVVRLEPLAEEESPQIEPESPKPRKRITAKLEPISDEVRLPPSPAPTALTSQETPRETAPAPSSIRIVASARNEKESLQIPKRKGQYQFPPVSILQASPEEDVPEANASNHQIIAERLKSTLDDFKIKVELGEVHIGPVITRYDLHPAPGVRVEKIASLEKNLAMALQAQSVRILAPVPGKGCVGIEIPNEVPQSVRVRDILETKVWSSSNAEIPIVLGKDVSGKPLVADLTKMPHLLIAGSTGSGKTVCINAVICSLLYHSSPDDLRFIMVDPKIVEMKIFNDLPHMLIPVVTDPKRVPNALKWLISEMDHRYQIFAKVGVRNIAGFNAKILKNREAKQLELSMDASLSPEERAAVSKIEVSRDDGVLEIPEKKLPYIVCIIDELADLMMVAPADIETCIARLAQLARAAGIHLVIATQRPSVNVITGVIKANLPSRISFKVASKIDSRTILDGSGADALIGRGDMLFIPPGIHHLVRAQGAFVSDEEIADIVEFLKVNGPPEYAEEVQREIERDPDAEDDEEGTPDDDNDWGDAMVPDAIEVLKNTKRASTSMLQRRLRIGYNRAARIMEILEERGLVGPDNGSQPREILVDLERY
jgi:S-DNA-T family DNA segregation ATPase FtsK/SpoIIIE